MSLILEALRKIEREKEAPDRGMVVVAAPPWSAPRAPAWVVAVAAAAAGAALALVMVRPRTAVPPPAPTTAARPAAAPVDPPAAPGLSLAPPVSAPARLATPSRASAPVLPPRPSESREAGAPPVEAGSNAPLAPAADPPLVLQAISERDGHPVAVVNQTVVEVGDVVNGARVLRIGAGEVEMEIARDGRRVVLRF